MTNPLIAARDAFAAQNPETRITLNGRDWGLTDTGSGSQTLLLIPGTLGRGDIFWQQIEALAPRLRILAVSYPDAGGIANWCADMLTLLDEKGVTQAAVLGSSLGGYLAQTIAGAAPARVSHLFAANTLHSVQGLETRPPYSADLANAPIETLRAGFTMAMQAWGESHPDQADLVEFLLAEVGGRITEGEMRARLAALKHGPELPAITLPGAALTSIESTDDPLIPPPMRDAVRARLPGVTGFRFLWGGHFPYVLRPQLYTNLIAARLGLEPLAPEWTENEVPEA
ncbi:alpha/beta fold hydrolase [Pararhodobacter sp.]|uniref:alpha/beta fold hydrolase n=1 Tax=Pararhodobacter sp. TaxID=2127056 RepID=UPI002FDE88A9